MSFTVFNYMDLLNLIGIATLDVPLHNQNTRAWLFPKGHRGSSANRGEISGGFRFAGLFSRLGSNVSSEPRCRGLRDRNSGGM